MSEAIVTGAALRIDEDLIRLVDLLEPFGRTLFAVAVGVILQRLSPECLFDVFLVCGTRNLQHFVIVALFAHEIGAVLAERCAGCIGRSVAAGAALVNHGV